MPAQLTTVLKPFIAVCVALAGLGTFGMVTWQHIAHRHTYTPTVEREYTSMPREYMSNSSEDLTPAAIPNENLPKTAPAAPTPSAIPQPLPFTVPPAQVENASAIPATANSEEPNISSPQIDKLMTQLELVGTQIEECQKASGLLLEKVQNRGTSAQEYNQTHPHKKRLEAKAVVMPRWVLRAAQPDQAWVARNTDTRDLKLVVIGDMLNGIGRVTSIEQEDGVWFIKGTMGEIKDNGRSRN